MKKDNYLFKLYKFDKYGNFKVLRCFYSLDELNLYCKYNNINIYAKDNDIKYIDLYTYRIYSCRAKAFLF